MRSKSIQSSTAEDTIIIDPPNSKYPSNEEEAVDTITPNQPLNADPDYLVQNQQTLEHGSSGRCDTGLSKTGVKGSTSSKLLGEDVPPEKFCLGSFFPISLQLSPRSDARSLAENKELLDNPPKSANAPILFQGAQNDRVSIYGPHHAPRPRPNRLAQNKDFVQKVWDDSTVMNAKMIVEARKIAGRPAPVDACHSSQENERRRDIESVLFDADEEIKQLPELERGDCSGENHGDLVGSTLSPDFVNGKEKRPLPLKKPGGAPSISLAVPPLDVSATSCDLVMDPSNPGVVSAQRDSHQGKSQANQSSTTTATVRPPDQNFKHGHRRGQMTSLSSTAPPFRSQEIKPSTAASHSASPAALHGPRVLPSGTVCLSYGPLTPEGHKTLPVPCVQKTVLHQMQPALVKTYAQASAYAPAQIHYRHPTRTHTFPQAQAHAQAQIQTLPLPQQQQLPATRNLIQPQFQPAAATATATATAAPHYHARFGRPEQDVRRTLGHSTNLPPPTTTIPTTQLPTTQPNAPAAHPRVQELTGRSGAQIALPRRPLISAARGSSGRARASGSGPPPHATPQHPLPARPVPRAGVVRDQLGEKGSGARGLVRRGGGSAS